MGCHIFHLEIFTVLQLTMNTLEDGLSTEGRRLEESANNPSRHPTNIWVQWAPSHSLWRENLSKDWTNLSSETQWLLWPHSTRGDELIVYCHETLISRYQANEINITRETFFNVGTNPRCERAQLPCHYNMTRCKGYWDFAHFIRQWLEIKVDERKWNTCTDWIKYTWLLALWVRWVQMTVHLLRSCPEQSVTTNLTLYSTYVHNIHTTDISSGCHSG